MNVLCYDPFTPAAEFPDDVEVVRDLNRIFKESDFVSLHAPNTKLTKNIVNSETLALMKSTAFLINTARGALVNEDDLYDALVNKKLLVLGWMRLLKSQYKKICRFLNWIMSLLPLMLEEYNRSRSSCIIPFRLRNC